MFKRKVLSQVVAAAAVSSFLVGCGSSSSSGSAASTTTDIEGSAFASYVSGAKVMAMAGVNEIAGPVTTTANGGFKLAIPNEHLKSDLVFKATGGTYTDEATGEQAASGELSVMAGAGTLKAGSSIHATPSSTIISKLMAEHGLSKDAAEKAFNDAFGYLPDTSVAPVDATKASDAEDAKKLAGVRAAAFSQLLKNLGLDKGDHSALLAALAEDLADGTADGKKDGQAVNVDGTAGAMALKADIANKFATALYDFANNADMNKSGLNTGQVGLIKFNTKAVSENYTFELTPPKMTQVGQAVYTLKVTNNADSSVFANKPVSMTPMMYMAAGHKHSTPNTGCTDTNDQGVATCTAYYLMASAMGNGDVMGNWELKFSVGMGDDKESVHFFPKVMMAMGDTARGTLKGDSNDQIAMGDMAMSRNYNIFNNGLAGMGDMRSAEFFISAQESMMSFPALVDGVELNTGTAYAMTPNNIIVEVSTDNTAWVKATTNDDGLWMAKPLAGLVDGEEGKLYVKLSVDGNEKTTDGKTAEVDNVAAEFTVTPGAGSMNMSM
ncbi:hypothetical protein [Alkalimarinus coralli]|uniref:hypothetical protein n=1 Tax=Alkalimarinus coralli TaxID=2935863 RepID=UPI00202B55DB|nr:hypothetical protein [Alkalimarinus coralli]